MHFQRKNFIKVISTTFDNPLAEKLGSYINIFFFFLMEPSLCAEIDPAMDFTSFLFVAWMIRDSNPQPFNYVA
jgi:hypothetical protein